MSPNKSKINTREDKLVSITEAAKINKVTRQAIYVAIKLNKLKATKDATRWSIHLDDLAEYRKQKYSRTRSTFKGELVFDNAKGEFSVNQVAKLLNVPTQKIYYATRSGKLTASRKGAAWVVSQADMAAYQEQFLQKRRQRKKAI